MSTIPHCGVQIWLKCTTQRHVLLQVNGEKNYCHIFMWLTPTVLQEVIWSDLITNMIIMCKLIFLHNCNTNLLGTFHQRTCWIHLQVLYLLQIPCNGLNCQCGKCGKLWIPLYVDHIAFVFQYCSKSHMHFLLLKQICTTLVLVFVYWFCQ